MQNLFSRSLFVVLMTACAHEPEQGATQAAPPPPVAPPTASASAATPPVASAAPSTPPPSPEEQKKADARRQLEADWAKLEAEDAAERARLTPEVHQSVAALVDKSYPTLHAALTAVLAGKQRRPEDVARDSQRHPRETLEFLGITPSETVLEYGPGEGWYTEILAPLLAKKGKLLVTTGDPNGPKDERATYYAERTRRFLARLPEAYGKVGTVVVDPKAPHLGPDQSVDAVLLFRGAHGMINDKKLDTYLAEFHRILKPHGVLGIEQHRAAAGADPSASAKNGYVPEAWLIAEVEKAGFKLAGKSEINANPKDTKDYPAGVWTLPPTLRLGEKDKDKYLAIGESDRMTLKFVKAGAPKASP
jgi:predicted methyltransferase